MIPCPWAGFPATCRVVESIRRDHAPMASPRPDSAVVDAVNACPDRGGELPVSAYPAGCCTGPTLFVCRAGRGSPPGRVSLAQCLECKSPSAPKG